MSRPPIIPPQPDDGRPDDQKFHSFAKRLLAVPKSKIDAEEKKEEKAKKRKAG